MRVISVLFSLWVAVYGVAAAADADGITDPGDRAAIQVLIFLAVHIHLWFDR